MGVVYLVGAGPGGRGLITVRGAALLAAAAHVVHDAALAPDLLTLLPESATREAVASPAQGARRAAELAGGVGAGAGAVVVRLLAGDGVSSPGAAEEMRRLEELGAAWEVVPGVAPEAAARGYAGVSGRGASAALRLDTNADDQAFLTIAAALDAGAAAAALSGAGFPAEAPALVVRAPGTCGQQVAGGTVGDLLPGVAAGRHAVLLAGAPAAQRLSWFERRPLFGRRVVVTRARAQSAELLDWLEGQGAEAVEFPAIRIAPPPDPGPLERAAAEVRSFDWLIFTSVNGVERFWAALDGAGLDARALGGARVAAIGPATAAALRSRGVRADVVPERYVAEGVLEALEAAGPLRGRRVLLARAAGARAILPERLAELGAMVTEVEAYRAVADTGPAEVLRRRLHSGELDAVTFTSSSTVQHFVDAVGTELGGAVVACIGPVTAATARELGLEVKVVAAAHTVAGLQAALLEFFAALR